MTGWGHSPTIRWPPGAWSSTSVTDRLSAQHVWTQFHLKLPLSKAAKLRLGRKRSSCTSYRICKWDLCLSNSGLQDKFVSSLFPCHDAAPPNGHSAHSPRMTTLWLKFQCVDSKPLFHSVKPMSTLEKHQLTTTSSVQCPSLLPADICKRPTVVSCASSLMKQPNPAGADISEIPKPHSATKEDCHHLSHPANLRRPLGVDTRIPSPCRRSQSCWCRLTSSFSWTS